MRHRDRAHADLEKNVRREGKLRKFNSIMLRIFLHPVMKAPMLDQQDEMLAVFLDESAENLAVLEQGLLRLDRDPSDRAPLDSAFRAAHSIKGGSSFFGIEAVTRLAHALENVLDRVRSGQMASDRRVVDLLLRSADALGRFLAETRSGGCPLTGHEELASELRQVLETPNMTTKNDTKCISDRSPSSSNEVGSLADDLTEYVAVFEGLAAWGTHFLARPTR